MPVISDLVLHFYWDMGIDMVAGSYMVNTTDQTEKKRRFHMFKKKNPLLTGPSVLSVKYLLSISNRIQSNRIKVKRKAAVQGSISMCFLSMGSERNQKGQNQTRRTKNQKYEIHW